MALSALVRRAIFPWLPAPRASTASLTTRAGVCACATPELSPSEAIGAAAVRALSEASRKGENCYRPGSGGTACPGLGGRSLPYAPLRTKGEYPWEGCA